MVDACMPEEFYEVAVSFLPPESEPGPKGGRRAVGHHTVLKVIWFVLVTGCRWKDVPQEIGCCGETGRTRLQAWERTGIWSEIHHLLLAMLNHEKQLHLETAIIDSTQVARLAEVSDGAQPRRSPEKRDEIHAAGRSRRRSPRIRAAAANRSDHREILPTVIDYPLVGGKPGRPRTHPEELYADTGYDSEATRSVLRWLGIEPHIRHRDGGHGSHLGSSTLGCRAHYQLDQRPAPHAVRYDRSGASIDAWTTIAAAVICLNILMEAAP